MHTAAVLQNAENTAVHYSNTSTSMSYTVDLDLLVFLNSAEDSLTRILRIVHTCERGREKRVNWVKSQEVNAAQS